MRKAEVYDNGIFAGILKQTDTGEFTFSYCKEYLQNSNTKGISLTLPKSQQEFHSKVLFPFFFNMLSEGANKLIQCTKFKIDEHDHFGLLLVTAENDTIGSITIKKV